LDQPVTFLPYIRDVPGSHTDQDTDPIFELFRGFLSVSQGKSTDIFLNYFTPAYFNIVSNVLISVTQFFDAIGL
jgi:hypothetical protein